MSDTAWFEPAGDGTFIVFLRTHCPDGSYYIRRWPNCTPADVIRRMQALQKLSDYRVRRFGSPPIDVMPTT